MPFWPIRKGRNIMRESRVTPLFTLFTLFRKGINVLPLC
jgi:hypothetical protein